MKSHGTFTNVFTHHKSFGNVGMRMSQFRKIAWWAAILGFNISTYFMIWDHKYNICVALSHIQYMYSFVVVCLVALAAVTSVQSDRSSTSPVETLPPKNVPDTPLSYAGKEKHMLCLLSICLSVIIIIHFISVCLPVGWLML